MASDAGEMTEDVEQIRLDYLQSNGQGQKHLGRRQSVVQSEENSNTTDDKRSLSPDNTAAATGSAAEGSQTNTTADGAKKRRTFAEMAKNQTRRASVPDFLKPDPALVSFGGKAKAFIAQEANFYRIHVTIFTITPLIFAAIFYASNTTPISFIDCLFVCVSAMTVTGLTTINVSIASDWQQAIIFFLMAIGNLSAVSVTMVLIRRHFFRLKFDDVIKRSAKARKKMKDVEEAHQKEKRRELIRLQKFIGLRKGNDSDDTVPGEGTPRSSASTDEIVEAEIKAEKLAKKKERNRKKQQGPLRADMIRRMDEPAVLINPAGMPSTAVRDNSVTEEGPSSGGGILSTQEDMERDVTEGNSSNVPDIRFALPEQSPSSIRRQSDGLVESPEEIIREDPLYLQPNSHRRTSMNQDRVEGAAAARSAEPMRTRFDGTSSHPRNRSGSDPPSRHLRSNSEGEGMKLGAGSRPKVDMFPRTQTIEFSEPPRERERRAYDRFGKTSAYAGNVNSNDGLKHRSNTNEYERTPTMATSRSGYSRRPTTAAGIPLTRTQTTAKERGFGGFPTPFEIAGQVIKKTFPKFQEQLTRTMTIPLSATLASVHSGTGLEARAAPYLSFDATVSRNSRFQELTEAQRDELGGVEYRSIDLLAKILPAYWFLCNFFVIVLVAPWLASKSAAKVHQVIAEQGATGPNTTWMWFFQVISAYSNTGLSLIDTSMIELPEQYFMLIPMAFLILAGNTAFPIFLRLFIWCISLVAPKNGRMYETLRFLLDHPRRCFVYLFPSSQTWFLLGVLVVLNSTDWIAFQVLDIGNSTIESWSVGQRIFDGLFQSVAVRAAGFQIISLLSLAPAVQFLYIVMMYISAYPIAMSVRNTNVYEERSLGVFNEEPGDADEPQTGGAKVWGTYLAAHARRQLAFDIWWLGFALWLICIIEKHNIQDPNSNGWFTVFSCLFELTSAYGTVGLSTGTPYDDFSLSGRFSTLGKLVVIAVMLRGRHRGLPVAIDRAVLLPGELDLEDEANDAYTTDEDGFIRSRSFAPSTSASFFPRTPTGISVPGTPRMSKMTREQSPPSLSMREVDDDEDGFGLDQKSPSNDADHPIGFNHYPHLAAIREVTPSPVSTPTPMSRMASYSMKSEQERKGEADEERPSDSASSASSSAKGKEKATTETATPQLLGGVKLEQLATTTETRHSEETSQEEEDRLNQLDNEFRDRYGSVTSKDEA